MSCSGGAGGKQNSDAWLAGSALALLNTPRVLMWEIQQREEGGIFLLCGTDIERTNETHQWDSLILSQNTKQPFGFRHSGCSQGENKLQSRGILCNGPREGAAALHQLCPGSSGSPGQGSTGCSSHTHREKDLCFPGACLLLMDTPWYSHGGMNQPCAHGISTQRALEGYLEKRTSLGKRHTLGQK